MSTFRPRVALAAVLALAGLSLAACGGGDDSDSAATTGAASTAAGADTTSGTGAGTSAASGPKGDVEVETWATQVCGSVGTWLQGINTKGTQLQDDVQGISDLPSGRDLLVRFMQDAVALTDSMISGVEAAGAPAVPNGEQLSADLTAALQPVKSTFEQAVTDAQALPTDDPTAFSDAASALGQQITDSQSTFTQSFDELQVEYNDPALNEAFNSVPECTALGSSG